MTEPVAPPRRSIRAAAGLSVAANVSQFGILFVASVIIARLLTPDELGVFAIAMAANGLIFAFQNTGIYQYITAQQTMPPRRIGALLTIQSLQSAAMALVLLVAAWLLAWVMEEPRLLPAIGILAIAALLAPPEMVVTGLLQREMRFDRLFVLTTAKGLVNAGVGVAGALHGLSYASLSWGAVAAAATGCLLALLFGGRALRVRPNLEGWREYWRFGASMLSIVAVTNLCGRAAIMLLGKIGGMASVGLYSRATGVAEMVQFGILEPLGRLVLPTLAEQRRRNGELGPTYLRAAAVITAVNWAAFGGLAVLAAPTIALIYGEPWLPAAPVLVWLCLGRIVTELVACYTDILVAAGLLHRLHRPVAICAVLGLGAFAAGASIGLVEAAMARTLEAALLVLLVLPLVRMATGLGLGALGRCWALSAAAAGAAVAPSLIWMQMQGWPQTLPVVELGLLVGAGILGWLAVLLVGGHEIRTQLLALRPRRAAADAGKG